MKKLFNIIIFLAFMPLLNAQFDISKVIFGSKIVSFQGGAVSSGNLWGALIIDSLLAINPHYSTAFTSDITTELTTKLSADYIMPDGSDNYYKTFGINGLDKQNAEWLLIMHYAADSSGNSGVNSFVKSGSVVKWHVGDSIYNSNVMPSHEFFGDEFIIITSTDDFNGVSRFYFESNFNCDGNAPVIVAPNLQRYYVDNNNFQGTVPDLTFPSMVYNRFNGNRFDSIISVDGLLSNSLQWMFFNSNSLPSSSVNLLLREMKYRYRALNPAVNMEIRLQANEAPTADYCNADLIALDSIYLGSSRTLTKEVQEDIYPVALNQTPYLILPDTIYIATNVDYLIQDDAIAAKSIDESALNLDYECNIGEKTPWGYSFNEQITDTGYYNLNVYAMAGCDTIDTLTCIARLYEPILNINDTISILLIGDSQIAGDPIVDSIRTTITGSVAELYGTQGVGLNLHEGHSGWSVATFLTSAPMNDGVDFNFRSYRTDSLNAVEPIDYAIIQLGINPITKNNYDTTWVENTWLAQIKTMIDSILADGTKNIILAMQGKCENTRDNWDAAYGIDRDQDFYIEKMHYIWLRLNQIYSGARYADNVFVCPNGVMIDRYDGYSDQVHLNNSGNWESTKGLRALIDYVIKYK